MSDSLRILIEAVDQASGPIRQVQQSIDRLQQTQGRLQRLGSAMQGMGTAATVGMTAPIVAGLGLAAKAAIDFESSMADVNKAFGLEQGTREAAAMSQQILQMSRRLPYSATGLAEIATEAGKLGVQRDQMGDFVQTVAQMGTAFDMSAAQAGDSIARLSNVFGYMDKSGRVNMQGLNALGDTINYLADSGATSEADIVNAMTRIGGVSRNFGLANNETAALTAAFLNLGAAPEVVATSLGSMLPMLQAATRQTPKFKAGLEEIGLSAEQLESNIKKDATGAIFDFFGRLNKASDKTGLIQSMFGAGSDARLIAQLAGDTTQLEKAFASLAKVPVNGMMDTFKTRSQTTANQLQLLRNGVTEAGINIGSAMLPAINSVVSALLPLTHAIASFAAANPQIARIAIAFGLVAAAIGPVLVAVGAVVSAVGSIMGAWAGVQAAMVGVSAAAASGTGIIGGFVATLTAIGAGPIIAGIAAVAAGAFLIYKNWATIKAFFSGFADGFMAGIAPLMPLFQSLATTVSSAFSSIVSWFGQFFSQSQQAAAGANNIGMAFGLMAAAVIGAIVNLPANIGAIFSSIGAIVSSIVVGIQMFFVNLGLSIQMTFTTIATTISTVFAGIVATVMMVGASIGTAFMGAIAGIQAAWAGLVGFFAGIFASITATVAGAVAGVVAAISGGAAQAIGAVQAMGAGMMAAIQGIAGQMFAAGANIVNSIAQGIQSAAGAVTSAISSIASNIRGALPFSPPEWGPLSDIMQTGGNIVHSIASGIVPGPITTAMRGALSPAAAIATPGVVPTSAPVPIRQAAPLSLSGDRAATSITVNLTVNGGGDAQTLGDSLEERLRIALPRLMKDMNRNADRLSYSS